MRYRCAQIVFLLLAVAGCGTSPDGAAQSAAPALAPGPEAPQKPSPPTTHAQATAPAADARQVVIDNFAFSPRTLTVAVGTRITWVNHDDVPHTATSSSKPRVFDSGALDTDGTFSFVFQTPGTYAYFCAVHPHMTGTVTVK